MRVENYRAERVFRAPGPRQEWEHFIPCKGCGKPLDMRKLGDLLAHEDECFGNASPLIPSTS